MPHNEADPTAYPLAWPAGWPRTPLHKRDASRYRFRRGDGKLWTFDAARRALSEELEKHASGPMVLSTNFQLRLDGMSRSNQRRPVDEGVAIYFTRAGRPMVMACDRHERAEENMRSLALALEAMRALERHGGGVMLERAFEGFAALPPPAEPGQVPWSRVLDIPPSSNAERINAAWRARVRDARARGDEERVKLLNVARDEGLRHAQG